LDAVAHCVANALMKNVSSVSFDPEDWENGEEEEDGTCEKKRRISTSNNGPICDITSETSICNPFAPVAIKSEEERCDDKEDKEECDEEDDKEEMELEE